MSEFEEGFAELICPAAVSSSIPSPRPIFPHQSSAACQMAAIPAMPPMAAITPMAAIPPMEAIPQINAIPQMVVRPLMEEDK